MIDTHCHLTYDGLYERVDEVIARAHGAGVDRMISVGTSPNDADRAVALAQRVPSVFATVGLHPHYSAPLVEMQGGADIVQSAMRRLLTHDKVLALGEMGLDQHYPEPTIETQRVALDWQLAVAAECDLPIVIHNREATDLTLAALTASGIDPARFVFHCFTGTQAELDAILAFGAMVSFTGIVTFGSATDIAAASVTVPDDRIMVETDSPYLTPAPHRKVRPNEPCYVPHTAAFLAEQRGVPLDDFVALCDANAARFFRLP